MVWEAGESPSSMSQASVTPKYVYDQSVEVMVVLLALSPQPALLTVADALSPPKDDSPLNRHVVLQA